MERLFEMRASGRYDRIILDTPPTRQAMDFLQAPERMMNMVDNKAITVRHGSLAGTARAG